jgi:hypothetical protein
MDSGLALPRNPGMTAPDGQITENLSSPGCKNIPLRV